MNQLQFCEDRKVEMISTASLDKDSSKPSKGYNLTNSNFLTILSTKLFS